MTGITFFDSTDPTLIPQPSDYAALYFDGEFGDAGRAARADFPMIRWITILGDGANCGIADFEAENPVYDIPGLLHSFALWRHQRHHPWRVYCDKSNAARAIAELGDLAPMALWWIATRDEGRPSPAELAADLAENWDAPIAEDRIWGNQFTDPGPYDESDLFRAW